MTLVPVLGLGFALGIAHATDADHVVAVSTIVSSQRGAGQGRAAPGSTRKAIVSAAGIGTLWGIGHTLTIMIAGGIMVGSRLVLPERAMMALELVVSVMLVVLGVGTLVSSRALHAHDGPVHAHEHHEGGGSRPRWKSLFVGVVHGLAGSGAIAVAVLSRTTSAALGVGYLACFGAGTIAGMLLLTTMMSLPFIAASKHAALSIWIRRLAGVASIALGVVLFIKIGFVDGCLT